MKRIVLVCLFSAICMFFACPTASLGTTIIEPEVLVENENAPDANDDLPEPETKIQPETATPDEHPSPDSAIQEDTIGIDDEAQLHHDQPDTSPAEELKPVSSWRLEGGVRSLHMELSTEKQGEPFNGSFIGSINELKVDQQYAPTHPYIQMLTLVDQSQLGFGLSYDYWTVATEDGGGGDGDVEMDAWTFYLVGRLNTGSKFAPFAEIGLSYYHNDFNPDPSWYAGGRRNFVFDNSSGIHVAAGSDYFITENLAANIYLRYVDVELDGKYIFRGDSRRPTPFVFPMEHVAYGAGLSYRF